MEAHVSLLDAIDCQVIVFQEESLPIVDRILGLKQMQALPSPSLAFFLQKDEVPAYLYEKTFVEARYSPFVVLHTSGSTALPKPVVVNHGTLASMDAYQAVSHLGAGPVIGPSLKGSRMLMAFPLFHMASFTLLLGFGVYYRVIGVLPPAVEPITARLIDAIHVNTIVQGSALPPSLIVDLYHEEEFLARIQRLDYMFYAGGSLPKEVGNKISSLTKLATLFGSTEIGYPAMEISDSSDWQFVNYSPFNGDEFRPMKEVELYEHFIVRRGYLDLFQSIFSTYPNQGEYATKDLYRRHATKPNLWKFCGRTDDVIVFSNAEKYNPVDFEDIVSSHPAIKSALMGGHGRFQSCLLIEPMQEVENESDKMTFLKQIWPTVQDANQISPAHARVMKDCILFTRKDKPPERAGKGTVQRMTTLQLYHGEIDGLYMSPELPNIPPQVLVQPQEQQSRSLRNALYQMVSASVWLDGQLSYDADFFALGLDSLQTLALSKQINAYLMQSTPTIKPITPSTIYTHSSIQKLELVLTATAEPSIEETSQQEMQRIFDEWSSHLPRTAPKAFGRSHEAPVVLLTGSTGSLGSYILQALLSNSGVRKIYCLNRGRDAHSRQTKSFETKGLKPDFQLVVFLQCEPSKQQLGLGEATYKELLQEVTHIIHNAWDVNFNRPLCSFVNSHVSGVRHMIQFCSESRSNAHLFFVSSESTVLGPHATHQGSVPEHVVSDWARAQHTGYAQSKLVAERLIATASQTSDLRSSICRVGQIAGPTSEEGVWSTREWFPTLIASSAQLQMLPDSLVSKDSVDWVPADTVGQSILELLLQSGNSTDLTEQESSTMSEVGDGPSLELHGRERSIDEHLETASALRDTQQTEYTEENRFCLEHERHGCAHGSFSGPKIAATKLEGTQNLYIGSRTNSSGGQTKNTNLNHTGSQKYPTVFHIVNPHPRPWQSLISTFQDACATPLQLVSFPAWLVALQKQAESGGMPGKLPAMALLEFFENSQQPMAETRAVLSTANAIRASKTLAALGPVDDAWVGVWMRQWGLSKG